MNKKMKGGYISTQELIGVWLVLLFYFLLGIIFEHLLNPLFHSFIFFVEHANDYLIIIFR